MRHNYHIYSLFSLLTTFNYFLTSQTPTAHLEYVQTKSMGKVASGNERDGIVVFWCWTDLEETGLDPHSAVKLPG